MGKEEPISLLIHKEECLQSWNLAAKREPSVFQDKIDEMLAFYLAAFHRGEHTDDKG